MKTYGSRIALSLYRQIDDEIDQQPKRKKSSKHDYLEARVQHTLSLCLGEELIQATQQGDRKRIQGLLDRGACLTSRNDAGWTALTWTAINNFPEIAKLLIERGANVNERDNAGWPAHVWATVYGHISALRVFVERGADVNFQDKDGWSLLAYAARYGHVDMGKTLLELGAKINHEDTYGWTPLMRAAYHEHVEFARMLMERGADVNRRSNKAQVWLDIGMGWTALMIASFKVAKKPQLVTLIMAYGGRLEDENAHGKNALQLAKNETTIHALKQPVKQLRPLTI